MLLWLFAIVAILALIVLPLPLAVIIFFAAVIILLCLMQMHFLRLDAKEILLFDGDNWFVGLGEYDKEPLSMAPKMLFKSECLLVIGFQVKAAKRHSKIYLTKDNCTQEVFRAVCRLL